MRGIGFVIAFVPVIIFFGLKWGDLTVKEAVIGGAIWLILMTVGFGGGLERMFFSLFASIVLGFWLSVRAFGVNIFTRRR